MATLMGKEVLMVTDVHNEAIAMSKGLGMVYMSVGSRTDYIQQVFLCPKIYLGFLNINTKMDKFY